MSHATWLWTVVQFGGKRVSIATSRSSTPIWATLSRAGNTQHTTHTNNKLAKYRREQFLSKERNAFIISMTKR